MFAKSLNDVIQYLDEIIHLSIIQKSRLGYFAILYRDMTIAVAQGIENGVFDDGARMELLDVHFANRYLSAYTAYQNNQSLTSSWRTAFDASKSDQLSILQHLLLGINAHIQLDLGISAAAISDQNNIHLLKNDFEKINIVIADVYNQFQRKLKKITWLVMLLRDMNPQKADAVLNFSMSKVRDLAWNYALVLSETNDEIDIEIIQQADIMVNTVANKILNPGTISKWILHWMLKTEQKDIGKNLTILSSV